MMTARITCLALLAAAVSCKPETPTSVLLTVKNATSVIPTTLEIGVWNPHGTEYGLRRLPEGGGTLSPAGKDHVLGTVLIHAQPLDGQLRILATAKAGGVAMLQGTARVVPVAGEQLAATLELQQAILSDLDVDGVPDELDNCHLAANPGQENTDASFFGDACKMGNVDAGPDWQPPLPGWALKFDGQDDGLALPRLVQNDFTIELWINTSCSENGRIIDATTAAGSKGFYLGLAGGKAVFSAGGGPTCTTATQVNTGQWVHLAVSRSIIQGQARLAINGLVDPSCFAGTGSLNDAANMIVGGGGTSAPFCGQIDELRVWNVAREINRDTAADKGHLLTGNEPNLVGYWHFDEGPGSTVLLGGTSGAQNTQIDDVDPSHRPLWVVSSAPVQ